jgi:hypothetical protein
MNPELEAKGSDFRGVPEGPAPVGSRSPALKRPPASRPSGEWSDDDFDVLANGEVVGLSPHW